MNNPGEYGYIKLFRKLIEWQWYDEPATKVVFIHCLLKANWTEKTWRGKEIKPGQFFTSVKHLSKDLGISEKQVRTALKRLEKTGELSIQGASNGTMITVCKYESYQEKEKTKGEQKASEGQTKGDNEESKESKEHLYEHFQTFWNQYHQTTGKPKTDKEAAFKHWKRLNQSEQAKAIEAIKPYFKSLNDPKFCKKARTYLSDKNFNDEFQSQSQPKRQLTSYPLIH